MLNLTLPGHTDFPSTDKATTAGIALPQGVWAELRKNAQARGLATSALIKLLVVNHLQADIEDDKRRTGAAAAGATPGGPFGLGAR